MDTSITLATISGIVYGWLLHSGMKGLATLLLAAVTVLSLGDFVRLAVFATWDFQSARSIKTFTVPRHGDGSSLRERSRGFSERCIVRVLCVG
jgi:hypothetical protein